MSGEERVCIVAFAGRENLGDEALVRLARHRCGKRVILLGGTRGTAGMAGRFLAMGMAARWAGRIEFTGGYLHGVTSGALKTALATLTGLALARARGASFRVHFQGAGLGPFGSFEKAFLSKLCGAIPSSGGFRDRASLELGRELFSNPHLELQEDPVALMELEQIQVHRPSADHSSPIPCMIVKPVPGIRGFFPYAEMAECVRELFGVYPDLAVARPGDLGFARGLAKGLGQTVSSKGITILSDPSTASAWMVSRPLVISARYHPALLAMRAGCPTLALVTDPKLMYLDDARKTMLHGGLNPGPLACFPETFTLRENFLPSQGRALLSIFRRRIALLSKTSQENS